MVDQGYCEGKAMRMIRLRRELGVNSDVMAKDMMWTRSQIDLGTYSDVRVKARLIFIIMIELQLYGSSCETFKLLVSVQGNGQNELQEYGEELQTLMLIVAVQIELQLYGSSCETFAAGVGSGYVVDGDTDRFSIVLRGEDEGQIHLHRHGVASVTSVLMLRAG
ncbi:Fibrocystin-L [Manis pentadactyla]|nr:Fibrocystin-L [Manis pentadactyla]